MNEFNEMLEHSKSTLELPAVLALLADCAISEEAKEKCRKLEPIQDAEDVRLLQDETEAA